MTDNWDDDTQVENRGENSGASPMEMELCTGAAAGEIAERLLSMFRRLMASPLLMRGPVWRDEWEGWERGKTWQPEKSGVYVLWASEGARLAGVHPVYVGEGQLGPRVWESFTKRKDQWNYAQFLVDDMDDREGQFWRKALERFAILALMPTDNRD